MFKYQEEYSWLTNICLNLTDACSLACVYCVPAGTRILGENGVLKNIEDIKIGDAVIGFDEFNEQNKYKKVYSTKVTQIFQHQANELLKITMNDGKQLYITDNHKVLNGRNEWTETKNLQETTGQIMSLGYLPINEDKPDIYNIDYVKGYFTAMWLTGGSHNFYHYDSGNIYAMRLAVKDDEIIERMKQYCDILNFSYIIRDFKISKKENLYKPAIFSEQKESYDFIENMYLQIQNNCNNENYLKGFIAACYDAKGHIDKDRYILSISNVDSIILQTWKTGLEYFNFQVKEDKLQVHTNLPVIRSRLLTKHKKPLEEQVRFFNLFQPAVKRKTFLALEKSCPLQRNNIKQIERVTGDFIVYNIATETRTYFAEGLAVHNCFVEQHPNYMSLEIATSAVLFVLENLEKKKKIDPKARACITYFGGEPTLSWDRVIVPLTSWIREKDFPIDLTITTNGTLLNKQRIQFLKDNNIIPLLSIDGDKETQNYNRPMRNGTSSFDAVSAIIPDLLEAFPNTTFRATIWPETAHLTFENYIFAIEKGFRKVFFMPDCRHPWTKKQANILINELNKIFELMLALFRKQIYPINFSAITSMCKNVLKLFLEEKPQKNISRSVFRCGLGTNSGAIGWDGSIYGCQEQPSKKNNIFYLGNIKTGINKELHIKLLSTYNEKTKSHCEDRSYCSHCVLDPICTGFNCPSSSYDLYKDFQQDSKIHCIWNNHMAQNCIILINTLLSENNELILNYLKRGDK